MSLPRVRFPPGAHWGENRALLSRVDRQVRAVDEAQPRVSAMLDRWSSHRLGTPPARQAAQERTTAVRPGSPRRCPAPAASAAASWRGRTGRSSRRRPAPRASRSGRSPAAASTGAPGPRPSPAPDRPACAPALAPGALPPSGVTTSFRPPRRRIASGTRTVMLVALLMPRPSVRRGRSRRDHGQGRPALRSAAGCRRRWR